MEKKTPDADPMKLGVLRDILKGVPARDRDHDISDYFERFITPKLPFTPTAKTPLHATLRVLLIGTSDEGSPFAKLAGHDVLELIWHFVRQEWAWRFFAEQRVRRAPKVNDRSSIAFAHVDMINGSRRDDANWPTPNGRYCNMMPFCMGNKMTLPEEFRCYFPIVEQCLATLPKADRERVGYLTVHESVVEKGTSQRRGGLHTEGFVREACDTSTGGTCLKEPYWHRWGFGHAIGEGQFDGGIFMASNLSDTTQVYNVLVPEELVGKGGDIEHLRSTLEEVLPHPARRRTTIRNGRNRDTAGGDDQEFPIGPADLNDGYMKQVSWPIKLRANELFWMTDHTPHESLPITDKDEGKTRQFFRLVTPGVDVWYAAHSTPNPLGIQPECRIAYYDKFTGKTTVEEPKEDVKGEKAARHGERFYLHGALRSWRASIKQEREARQRINRFIRRLIAGR